MKLVLIALLATSWFFTTTWLVDFEKAKKIAKTEKKFILLNFSGSHWCGPCIQMRKEIFDTPVFERFATESLVLVNADFPRSKKNLLPAEQRKKNELLAEHFNKKGQFPYTILLTSDGQHLQAWEGLPTGSADDFVRELQKVIDAGR